MRAAVVWADGLVTGEATPQRLRRLAAVLILGAVVAGVVGLIGGRARVSAVGGEGERRAALAADSVLVYRALADADATVTSGYVRGGTQTQARRERFDADISEASAALVRLAGGLGGADASDTNTDTERIETIAAQLPVYTGLVETANTYNRQGLPLGLSYLSRASTLMRETILPAASDLHASQNEALDDTVGEGGRFPVREIALGLAGLVGVVGTSVREQRRTNRVLNHGLVAAGVAFGVLVVWWATAGIVASAALRDADKHSDAADALDRAQITALQARSIENLVLLARGAAGSSEQAVTDRINTISDEDGLLDVAARADPEVDIGHLLDASDLWHDAHEQLRDFDEVGDYAAAVASATGEDPEGSEARFAELDTMLTAATEARREAYERDAGRAHNVLLPLPFASVALGALAVAGVTVGIGRRLGEYR